jgi:hypothetical protein
MLKIPPLSQKQNKSITLPQLDGGINVADLPFNVNDNQCTDLNNLWYNDKTLSQRMGLINHITSTYGEVIAISEYMIIEELYYDDVLQHTWYGFYVATAIGILRYNLTTNTIEKLKSNGSVDNLIIDSGTFVNFTNNWSMISFVISPSHCLEAKHPKVEFIGSGYMLILTDDFNFSTISDAQSFDNMVTNDWTGSTDGTKFYIPITMWNKSPDGTGGDAKEQFNKLTGAFAEQFNPNGTDHIYYLAQKNIADTSLHVSYLATSGTTYHWYFDVSTDDFIMSTGSNTIGGNDVYCAIDKSEGKFYFTDVTHLISYPLPATAGVNNTVTIQASLQTDQSADIKNCNISAWYGSYNQGLSGGTRLFLSGNDSNANYVYFSDLNNPTYFPENNFISIGQPSNKITAFAKQQDYLAVFNETSLYRINYTTATITVTVGTTSTIVPILFEPQIINPNIGCTAKNSIQLINNHLVWLHKDKVYILVTNDNTNENNVRQLSRNIQPMLTDETDLSSATSVDFMGHYMLFINDAVYLWNYEQFPYIDNSDTEKAQKRLAWYYWTLPVGCNFPILIENELYCFNDTSGSLYKFTSDKFDKVTYVDEVLTETAINTLVSSKHFDFGKPTTYKKVIALYVHLPESCDTVIDVSYDTEDGTDTNIESIDTSTNTDDIGFAYRLYPNYKKVRYFNFSLSSSTKGKYFALAGASLEVELKGDVR